MSTCPEDRARRQRRHADRLERAAETVDQRDSSCRDVAGERDRLREAAAKADQRATIAERAHRR